MFKQDAERRFDLALASPADPVQEARRHAVSNKTPRAANSANRSARIALN